MDVRIKKKFIELWKMYFNNAELPITFYYTSEEGHAELVKPGSVSRCVIGALSNVREGKSLCFDIDPSAALAGKDILALLKRSDRTSNISSPAVSLVNLKGNATKNPRSLSESL